VVARDGKVVGKEIGRAGLERYFLPSATGAQLSVNREVLEGVEEVAEEVGKAAAPTAIKSCNCG
jgi:hypothetical protein